MARGVTQDDVNRAADGLLAQGERPTVERVRQFLGTGSPNTVTRLLDVWWSSLSGRLAASARKAALPDAPAPVTTLATQMWEEALTLARTHAEAALEDDHAALAAARLEADARVAAASQAVADADARSAEAAAALQTALQRLEDRQHLIDQQAAQLADLVDQRSQALHRLEQTEAEAAALRERVDALQTEAELIRGLQAAHIRAVEDRAHAEVDRARQEARDREKALQAAEKSHWTRVRELEAELAQSRSAAADQARILAAEQARRETLEQQLAEMHRRLEAALKPPGRAVRAVPRKPRPARGAKKKDVPAPRDQ